jgi:signal transduction histidine kinase
MNARGWIGVACALMLVGIAALDVLTPQRLVAAILLNVPIALSGLVYSRRWTAFLVGGALTANLVAGVLNAQGEGGADNISLLNRALLAASFALVGWMTVRLSQTSLHLDRERLEGARARRQRDRERLTALAQSGSLASALEGAAQVLSEAFAARGAVLAVGGTAVFAAPRGAFPAGLPNWGVGTTIPVRLLGDAPSNPVDTDTPGEYGLNANRALVGGVAWDGGAPVLVAVLEPSGDEDAPETFGALLPALRDALARASLGEKLEAGRAESERRAGIIRDLVYAFSHDLRTPITANVFNMRLALEGTYGQLPAPYLETLRNGVEANNDLLELADSLLVLARLEGGEPEPPRAVLSLEDAARASAARLTHAPEMVWHVTGDTRVRGHAPDLRRVVQNLLDNAVRHSPSGEPIEVFLERLGIEVRLEVWDRGPGVPIDLEPRLFQRFSSGKAGGGTGLGLYLAKRIVEAHGGRIGYHPRVGGGSAFWLELPAAAVEPQPAAPQEVRV